MEAEVEGMVEAEMEVRSLGNDVEAGVEEVEGMMKAEVEEVQGMMEVVEEV